MGAPQNRPGSAATQRHAVALGDRGAGGAIHEGESPWCGACMRSVTMCRMGHRQMRPTCGMLEPVPGLVQEPEALSIPEGDCPHLSFPDDYKVPELSAILTAAGELRALLLSHTHSQCTLSASAHK